MTTFEQIRTRFTGIENFLEARRCLGRNESVTAVTFLEQIEGAVNRWCDL